MYSIVYYTANKPPPKLAEYCRKQIEKAKHPVAEIVCVTWQELGWGDQEIVTGVPASGGGLRNLFWQLLVGLRKARYDHVYLAEDDVLYPAGAFDWSITPHPLPGIYYNLNLCRMNSHGFWPTPQRVNSACAGHRKTLLQATDFKLDQIRRKERIRWSELGKDTNCDELVVDYCSVYPQVDVRWGGNLTGTRKAPGELYGDRVPFWGLHSEMMVKLGMEEKP